jgi:two-component system cell cycle sensor histidine kinase/response regulator CckA
MSASNDPVIPLSTAPAVLVVDDEQTPRSITCRMVRGMGYQVRSARDGREALRYLKQHPGEIDLLLSDVVMPIMDGGELAERARELQPALKIVLMSGYPQAQIAELVAGYPDIPFLTKPVGFGRLYDLLAELLGPAVPAPIAAGERVPARYRNAPRTTG